MFVKLDDVIVEFGKMFIKCCEMCVKFDKHFVQFTRCSSNICEIFVNVYDASLNPTTFSSMLTKHRRNWRIFVKFDEHIVELCEEIANIDDVSSNLTKCSLKCTNMLWTLTKCSFLKFFTHVRLSSVWRTFLVHNLTRACRLEVDDLFFLFEEEFVKVDALSWTFKNFAAKLHMSSSNSLIFF